MRLVRGVGLVVVGLLAACDRGVTPVGPGSQNSAKHTKPPEPPIAATLQYPLELSVAGGRVWIVASDRDLVLLEPGKSSRVVKSFGWVNAVAADDRGVWVSANDELAGKTRALWYVTNEGEASRVEEGISYVLVAPGGLIVAHNEGTYFRTPDGTETGLSSGVGRMRIAGDMVYTLSVTQQVTRLGVVGEAGRAWENLGAFPDIIEGFDVDANNVYASVSRGIGVLPLRGGPVRMLAENLDEPRELVADGSGGVHVLTYGTHDDFWGHHSNNDGALLHVDAAGTVTPLAADFIGAGRIALTADTIYVTDVYGGRVLAVPRH